MGKALMQGFAFTLVAVYTLVVEKPRGYLARIQLSAIQFTAIQTVKTDKSAYSPTMGDICLKPAWPPPSKGP